MTDSGFWPINVYLRNKALHLSTEGFFPSIYFGLMHSTKFGRLHYYGFGPLHSINSPHLICGRHTTLFWQSLNFSLEKSARRKNFDCGTWWVSAQMSHYHSQFKLYNKLIYQFCSDFINIVLSYSKEHASSNMVNSEVYKQKLSGKHVLEPATSECGTIIYQYVL